MPLPSEKWRPRYNVAPGTWITGALRYSTDGDPLFDEVWWGYRPQWADEKAPQPINATAEKVATSNYFKGAFARHRCLIPADGWFEWAPGEGGKQPYFITRTDRQTLFLGGIWAPLDDDTACCAIITEPARGVAREIHGRMPLVLEDRSLEAWLDPDLVERDAIRAAVHHLDADAITAWPVSSRVNQVANDDAELIQPLATDAP